jgi:hypothetical protein
VLYAYPFTAAYDYPSATVTFTWAVDDRLGDPPGGANPIGVWLNGVPLSESLSGGGGGTESTVQVHEVALGAGSHVLYVYQRDIGCSVSGILFSCRIAPSAAAFCDASDSSLLVCPCSNPGDPDTGCDVPQGTGGVGLTVVAQVGAPANRATLAGFGYPPAAAPGVVLLRASALDPAAPVVFGDGLRCIGTPLVRLAGTVAAGGFSTHAFGHGAMSGSGTFHYQLWFRSTPAAYCTPDAFNLSNGRTLLWQ